MTMLRRLNVRTRLVAVIAVPLVLLLAVAVPEALERRERASVADQAVASTEQVADVASAVDALQGERILSASQRAGDAVEADQALQDQRTLTDAAVEQAEGALARLAGIDRSLAPSIAEAQRLLADLPDVRSQTDAADSLVPWVDPFAPLLGALLDVQEAVGSANADAGIGDQLSLVALVARAKDAAAEQAAQLAAAATWGELRGDQEGILADQRADEASYRTAYLAGSPADERTARRAELARGDATVAGRNVDQIVSGAAIPALTTWLDLSASRQGTFRAVEVVRADEGLHEAQAIESSSRRSSTGYLVLAGGGLLLAFGLALAAARSITRPLRELTDAAENLAEDRLPKLVDALRHPVDDDEHYLAAALEPIVVRSDDELGHLAHAFNAVQSVAVDVAAEQAALLKKGISDLYVNLARRNQALIDRQIQLLDELEVEEQDAEVLEHLYLLDHLATRMRRNAESLLILAGSESGPRRSKPIDVMDVVRAAVSEVEEYERVDLGVMAAATLQGPAVSDVAHLVAELLENATQFSSPETMVQVDGARTGGSYQLVISDRGVGMRQEQLDELNAVLQDPPVTGLALGRSLGCLVAARLAARHGITVRLRAGATGGVSAYVILPRHLLLDEAAAPLTAPAPAASTAHQEPDEWSADWAPTLQPARPTQDAPSVVVELAEPVPGPALLRDALPAHSNFDAGLKALMESEREPSLVEPPVQTPADAASDPAAGGLQRRTPGATTEALPAPVAEPTQRRSPEEVRAMLSRFRDGLQAGRANDPLAEEERS
jgi:HAMP domain-containing protein